MAPQVQIHQINRDDKTDESTEGAKISEMNTGINSHKNVSGDDEDGGNGDDEKSSIHGSGPITPIICAT